MRERKPIAALLTLVMLISTLFGTVPSAYAQSGEQTTEDEYISELQIVGIPKGSYTKGEELTLQLSVKRKAGGSFGIRLFDTEVTFNTAQFSLTDASAATAAGNNLSIQADYKPAGGKQSIKLIYSNTEAQADDCTDKVVLATITLQVKESVVTDKAVIGQILRGMSDAKGNRVKNLKGETVAVNVSDGLQSYRFGLAVTEGGNAGYQPGDKLTLRSYLSSQRADTVSGASVTISYDPDVFEAAEGTAANGVTTVLKTGEITLLYIASASASAVTELPLSTFTLTVKDDAAAGLTEVTQKDTVINKSETISDSISADSLQMSILKAGSCSFELIPQEKKDVYFIGDELTLDVVVSANEAFEPRMITEEISFNKDMLTFVTAAAVAENTVASGKSGLAKWVYSDIREEGAASAVQRVTLGSLTLKVADTVLAGTTYLNHNDSNLVVKKGTEVLKYNDVTANSFPVLLARTSDPHALFLQADSTMGRITAGTAGNYEPGVVISLKAEANDGYQFKEWQSSGGGTFSSPGALETSFTMPAAATTVTAVFASTGVTVSGKVALTAGDVSQATVVLTQAPIAGADDAYRFTAGEADYTAEVAADGTYSITGVKDDTYTLLIRKPGALYYQKDGFKVEASASTDGVITFKDVTLSVGDLNLDGTINDGDLGELISNTNFNKTVADQGVLVICDLNADDSINDGDLGELISSANFNHLAILE